MFTAIYLEITSRISSGIFFLAYLQFPRDSSKESSHVFFRDFSWDFFRSTSRDISGFFFLIFIEISPRILSEISTQDFSKAPPGIPPRIFIQRYLQQYSRILPEFLQRYFPRFQLVFFSWDSSNEILPEVGLWFFSEFHQEILRDFFLSTRILSW